MNDSSEEKINKYTIAFYNVENLFDTIDDPKTMDEAFTEHAARAWNPSRFKKKVKKVGRVISNIGFKEIGHPPVIIGVAEVENAFVLKALVESKFLKNKDYDFIHFDSPDERGIDTALLYRKDYFKVIDAKPINIYVTNVEGAQDFTRDILHVTGTLEGNLVHIMVNHWPSRRAGAVETAYRRLTVATKARAVIKEIMATDPDARIIFMGDFNDDPKSESIQHLVSNDFYNPMELLLTHEKGSTSYRGAWNLFDQLIMSHNFLKQHGNSFRFENAAIFNPENLRAFRGRNKGTPFRTYAGKKYLGGMSDHFPIYGVFSVKS